MINASIKTPRREGAGMTGILFFAAALSIGLIGCGGGGGSGGGDTGGATPAPTVSMSFNPTSVTAGTDSTLTWSSTNATSCTATGGWIDAKPTSGTQVINSTGLNGPVEFSLTCNGPGGSGTGSATLTVTPEGTQTPVVWVPDWFGQKVQIRSGEDPGTQALTLQLSNCNPNSVAVTGGKLYVVCNNPDRILVYDRNTVLTTGAGNVEKTITNPAFDGLIGAAVDAQGNLFVSSFGMVDNNGNCPTNIADPGHPQGTDATKEGQILEITAAQLAMAQPAAVSQLVNSPACPAGIAVDGNGGIWVVSQFNGGLLADFPAASFGMGDASTPSKCYAQNGGCPNQANTGGFNAPEGIAIFNNTVWVSNNGGNAPGASLVGFAVANLAPVKTFPSATQETTVKLACPGGLFVADNYLWTNDEGYGDAGTTCGAGAADQGSGVGAVLRFTQAQLSTDPGSTFDTTQIERFAGITSRPGFGGIFVESP